MLIIWNGFVREINVAVYMSTNLDEGGDGECPLVLFLHRKRD